MTTHKLEIEAVSDSRAIIRVNGYCLDVMADEDGIVATLTQGDDIEHHVTLKEIAHDW